MSKYLKFTAMISLIGIFLLISFCRRSLKVNRLVCRLSLWLLDIKVEWLQNSTYNAKKNHYIVCNHLSYLDVLILNSHLPSCFVTSQEVRETPGLGLISALAGCIFVERRNKLNIGAEISKLTLALKNGLNVCVFPEATSTNGERVLPFKKSLFQASINSETPVLPVTINYLSINNQPISSGNRDLLFWYGDMDFLPHLLTVCSSKNIKCQVTINRPIEVSKNSNPVILSEIAWDRVSSSYVPKAASNSTAELFLTTPSFTW